MFVYANLKDYLRRGRALWRRRRIERYISSLPLEIRKDIGWRNEDGVNEDAYDFRQQGPWGR